VRPGLLGRLTLGRLLPDLGPARDHPAFRRLLAGGLLSTLGSSMTSFAVVLQLWDLTRSSLAVGLLGLTFVPVLFVGLLGGAVADTVDRRKLALAVSVCLMAVSAAFAAQAYAGLGQVWLLYALAMVQAVLQATAAPSQRTFTARLVPPGQLTAAIALNTLSGRIVMLAGPALAGLIAAAWGVRACYAIDAVSFVASLYATARLPAMRPAGRDARRAPGGDAARGRRPGLGATAEGLRFIGRRPLLVAAFLTDLDAMLLGLPVALFPALNAAHFGGSPRTLGLLNAAVGVGGLVSAVLSGPASRVARPGRGMLAGTMTWGAAIACFGLTASLPLALLLLAVAGAADTLTVTFRSAMVQTVTPDEFRGRVSSVEYIIGSGGAPVGNVESGAVAALTSPAISTVAGGLGCLAIAALIGLVFPAFARYRSQAAGPGEPATRDTLVAVELQVTDNPDKARFEIVADGELAGFAQYYLRDGQIAFTHTETDDRFRGHGLGGHLVQAALDAARERHLAVLPYCPFVKSWIGAHPEYADLIGSPGGR
jgi:predicted GNAT family acetyltransferase/MFS-type transporter involved in bile tolerance (Atg22 family)